MSPAPILIFSDLDGTLLDHDDYSFAAAMPALHKVFACQLPLILTTSKTLAEVSEINRALQNPQLVIAENGGVIAVPAGTTAPDGLRIDCHVDGYAMHQTPPTYPQIRRFIEQQRERHAWPIRGFGDMSDAEVAASTGLDLAQSALARQRLASEPFEWLDPNRDMAPLLAAAIDAGLQTTRGGRFWHLMGPTSKADAMRRLSRLLAGSVAPAPTVIALGDSENDRAMLEAADIAVVVRRHDGSHLDCRGATQTLFTEQAGPAGWNSAMLQLLADPQLSTPA